MMGQPCSMSGFPRSARPLSGRDRAVRLRIAMALVEGRLFQSRIDQGTRANRAVRSALHSLLDLPSVRTAWNAHLPFVPDQRRFQTGSSGWSVVLCLQRSKLCFRAQRNHPSGFQGSTSQFGWPSLAPVPIWVTVTRKCQGRNRHRWRANSGPGVQRALWQTVWKQHLSEGASQMLAAARSE